MKIKQILVGSTLAIFSFATPAIADNDNAPGRNQDGQSGIHNPESHERGERNEPRHRIDEFGEGGFEAIQFLLVGGAVVIAVVLAYNAGKRNRKKKEDQE